MNVLKQEPALAAGVAAAVGIAVVYNLVTPEQAEAWREVATLILIPILQALLTRWRVFSPATLEKAGLDPREVQERADDPSIPPLRRH